MGLTQTTAPTSEPVTLEEARAWIREEEHYEDDRILALISAGRDYVERVTARQIVTATWKLTQSTLSGVLELPHPPLQSVSSITYVDSAGATQTVSASVYDVFADTEPGRVVEAANQTWPADVRGNEEDVAITFVAGYTAATVPAILKQAVLVLVAHWFDLRTPVHIGATPSDIPLSFESLVWAYRAKDFA